jgi:hypothetical protein
MVISRFLLFCLLSAIGCLHCVLSPSSEPMLAANVRPAKYHTSISPLHHADLCGVVIDLTHRGTWDRSIVGETPTFWGLPVRLSSIGVPTGPVGFYVTVSTTLGFPAQDGGFPCSLGRTSFTHTGIALFHFVSGSLVSTSLSATTYPLPTDSRPPNQRYVRST